MLHVVFVKIFHFKIKSVFPERQDALFYFNCALHIAKTDCMCYNEYATQSNILHNGYE